MLRLLQIEYFKLKNSKYFWVLSGLFALFLLAVPLASKSMLDWLGQHSIDDLPFAIDKIPVFDFVDIWQNLTWVYKSFSIFLGFIVVISTCNEFSYGTAKQNVIDGLSRREFLWTKLAFIIANATIVSVLTFLIGLLMGFLWSPVTDFTFIVRNIEFIGAYFLHLIAFQLFCFIVSMLVKRSGIVIAILIFYGFMIEPFAVLLMKYEFGLEWLSELLPMSAVGNVIRFPFAKYALQETQDFIAIKDLAILLGYTALFYFISLRMIKRRDLA